MKPGGEKKLYGKVSKGLIRTTYIIDPEGRISAGWINVKVRVKRKSGEVKHVDIVKEELKELQE
jgi:thioredoxin-dependent peroxiredoxin